MNITLVPPEEIMFAWNRARVHLEPAIERCKGRWTMEHLCAALATGRSQLWLAFDDNSLGRIVTGKHNLFGGD